MAGITANATEMAQSLAGNLQGALSSSLPGISKDMLGSINADSLSSAASSIAGSSSGIASQAVSQAQGMVSGLTSSVSNAVNSAMDQAGSLMSSVMGSADSILGSSLGDIASSFPDAAKQMFGAINDSVGSLGGIVGDIAKGPKEVDSLLKSLSGDSSEAMINPVAFISKPLNDVMKGLENTVQGSNMLDSLMGLGKEAVSNLGSVVGSVLDTVSDIGNAINSVTNGLASAIGGGISSLISGGVGLVSSVLGPVVSTVTDFAGSLIGGIKDTISGVIGGGSGIFGSIFGTGASIVKSILNTAGTVAAGIGAVNTFSSMMGLGTPIKIGSGSTFSSSAVSRLPYRYQSKLANRSTSSITAAASSYLTTKLNAFKNASKQLHGITTGKDLLNRVMGLGGTYPEVFVNKKPGTSVVGNNNTDVVTKIYKAAMSVCGNVQMPDDMVNYAQNKDLFDVLAGLSVDLGLSDLIRQLFGCDDNTYIDNRTINALKKKTSQVAGRGDVFTYQSLQESIGSRNITNASNDIRTMIANMAGTQQELTAVRTVINNAGLTEEKIIFSNAGSVKAINGQNTTYMTNASTNFIDSVIGKDARILTQACMLAFAA